MYMLETKKKYWTTNYQGITLKPTFEESCFSVLVVVCHVPPQVSRTACTRAVKEPRQGIRQVDAPTGSHHDSPCGLTDFRAQLGNDGFKAGPSVPSKHSMLLLQLRLLGAASHAAAGSCAASSSSPVLCAPQMFSGLAEKAACEIFFISLT